MIANGFAEELVTELGPEHPLHGDAQEIVTAAQRMSEIALELNELTKRSANPPTRIYLDEMMGGMESQIAQAAGENVTLDMVPSESPLWVNADPEQLSQVLDAVAHGTPETRAERTRLTVSWNTQEIQEQIELAPLKAGSYVCITIRDDGRGIDPGPAGVQSLIPASGRPGRPAQSFSRRPTGWCGSGRGISRSIRNPSAGPHSSFTCPVWNIRRPRSGRRRNPPRSKRCLSRSLETTRETILVVDDEAGIRGLMRKILTRERYVVIDAGSAEEAITVAAEHGERIDLLLTDVMLPQGCMGRIWRRNCSPSKPV